MRRKRCLLIHPFKIKRKIRMITNHQRIKPQSARRIVSVQLIYPKMQILKIQILKRKKYNLKISLHIWYSAKEVLEKFN